MREYPGVKLSRDFYDDWKKEEVIYNPSATGKLIGGGAARKTVMINTKSGHQPKKIFESEQAIVMDDFLPTDLYERLQQHVLKADYEYLNMQGKISRAWHVHDGHPLRSKNNTFYYAQNHPKKPNGKYVYPTKTDMDFFMEALLGVQPHVQGLIGQEAKDWWHCICLIVDIPP